MTQPNATVNEMSTFRGRGSLAQMVAELRRQIDSRLDFVVDTRDLKVEVAEGKLVLRGAPSAADFVPRKGFTLQRQAVRQLGERATPSVPVKFLEEAAEKSPNRIADYLTGVMHDHHEARLVRVLDDQVRAVLSDGYRCIDNSDVAATVLEEAQASKAAVLEATLSDTAMRIKLVVPSLVETVERVRAGSDGGGWYAGGLGSPEYLRRVAANSRGDMPKLSDDPNAVHPILTVGNSETGHGSFFGRVGILQAVCFNIATVETKLAQVHLGARLEVGIYTRETIAAEARAIMLKGRDLMRTAFVPEKFRALCDRVRATIGQAVPRPVAAVECAARVGGLGLDRLEQLVAAFSKEPGGATVYNLGQAIARVSQDVPDSDAASDWEAFAGEVLTGKHSRELIAAGAQ